MNIGTAWPKEKSKINIKIQETNTMKQKMAGTKP